MEICKLFTTVFSDNTDTKGRYSSQQLPAPKTGMSRPSSSLREEVERLSMVLSQSEFEMKSGLCLQTNTSEKFTPSPSGSVVCTEPDVGNTEEKTVLLSTTMEMTLSNNNDIVTVETKAKTPGPSSKKKHRKKKDACGQNVISSDCGRSADQRGSTDDVLQTEDHALEEVIKPQSPKTLCRSVITTRIPKLSKTESGRNQKMAKNKFRFCDPKKPESFDTGSTDLEDFFTDPDIKFLKARQSVKLPPEKDTAEETEPKITCRRSRTKGRRKTFVALPPPESENSPWKLDQLRGEAEIVVQENSEAYKHQERPKESHADEVTCSDLEHVDRLSLGGSEVAFYGRSLQRRCRETFIISVDMDRTSSRCEAGESQSGVVQDPSHSAFQSDRAFVQDTPSSCKRPWVATQDPGSRGEEMGSSSKYDELLLDQDCSSDTEFQKTKKPRRDKTSGSRRSRSVHREERDALLNDNKERKKSSYRKKRFRCENGSCDVQEASDVNASHRSDLQGADSPYSAVNGKEDTFEHLPDSKPPKSKSRVDVKPRKTSKLHASRETRNLRDTFVVCRRKTQDSVGPDDIGALDASDACSYAAERCVEAVHHTVGDLLMDEMPPWLAADVSSTNPEVDSLLRSPARETNVTTAETESASVATEASPGVESFMMCHLVFIQSRNVYIKPGTGLPLLPTRKYS